MAKQTITLSEEDLQYAVRLWLGKFHGEPNAWEINISTRTETQGYGRGEHQASVVEVTVSRRT